ncbi:hypothetical protein BDF14DRAFT_1974511 [Spinellus fusiger]|nr:hypothetical protein BDF14DRAFT_1974511 [Spinellus fusiger]
MCDCLRSQSLVDRVFIYYSSNVSNPLNSRDNGQEKELEDGDIQDMICYIENNNRVCLVVLDHAGISTNCEDLEQNNKSLQKIVVDTMAFNNKV